MCYFLLSITRCGLQNSTFSASWSFNRKRNMNSTAAPNTSSVNATISSRIVPSTAEVIALGTAFILTFVFIVVGNLLTIVLFAANKRLRKRSLFLVINMAFADLMLGTLSLPIYIYDVGTRFQLWKGGWPMPLSIFYTTVDTFFSQASLISAAFISAERPFTGHLSTEHYPCEHTVLVLLLCGL